MGKEQSRLQPRSVADLMRMTDFTNDELQIWYKEFRKNAKHGRLSRDEFIKGFRAVFPQGDAMKFVNHVFRTFDVNKDGVLNFREFVIGLSLSLRGSFDEKLYWAFNIYDVDGNGSISQSEMKEIVGAMCAVCRDKNLQEIPFEDFFLILDKNKDGAVSWAEFRKGIYGNQSMTNLLRHALDCNGDQ